MYCQTLNVFPKFPSFILSNVNQCDKRCIKKRLLRRAVSQRKKELRSLKRSLSTYEKEIQNILSSADKFILDRAVKKNVERSTISTIKPHQKKNRSLSKKNALPFTLNETIHNSSTITLTTEELDILKSGLKHSIHPSHVNKTDAQTTFDFILRTMTKIQKMKNRVLKLKRNYQIWPILTLTITDHQSML